MDVLSATMARRWEPLRTLLPTHLCSACLLLLLLILGPVLHLPGMPSAEVVGHAWPALLLAGLVLGILNAVGNLCLLYAFRQSALALISPLVSAYGIVPMLCAMLTEHETFSPLALLALLVMAGGMLIVTVPPTEASAVEGSIEGALVMADDVIHFTSSVLTISITYPSPLLLLRWLRPHLNPGVLWAMGAMLCFGIELSVMSLGMTPYGPLLPVFASRLCSSGIFGLCLLITVVTRTPSSVDRFSGREWMLIVSMSLADLLAAIAFIIGSQLTATGLIAALSLWYPAIPMLFGLLFRQERLSRRQWLGTISLLLGVATLTLCT